LILVYKMIKKILKKKPHINMLTCHASIFIKVVISILTR
jgi:hypothetical protein